MKKMNTRAVWLCLIIRTFSRNKFLSLPTFFNSRFYASTELKDKTQVGLFLEKEFDEESKINFGLGVRKVVNDTTIVKAKIDKDLRTAIFADCKIGNGFGVQTTIARQFSDEKINNGFLESDYLIGLKLKYDS